MLKRVAIIFIVLFVGALFSTNTFIISQDAHAYNKPWDQGHDGTNPNDPEEDDDGCKEPPCEECKASASPVLFVDGSYHNNFSDIILPGKHSIELKRYYRSKHSFRTGYFGFGWTFSFELSLRKVTDDNGDNHLVVMMPNGQVYKFYPDSRSTIYSGPNNLVVLVAENPEKRYVMMGNENEDIFSFSEDGKLVQIEDKFGKNINLTYIDSCISTISSLDGRGFTFTKGANGKISSVTDHLGRVLTYTYDSEGNLTGFTNAAGDSQSYSYNTAKYLMTGISDFLGNAVVSVSYDSQDRVISLTENSLAYTYTYLSGNQVRRTDIDGSWTYTFDSFGRVIGITDPKNQSKAKVFDSDWNLTSLTDFNGNTTTYTYDEYGNVLSVIDPEGFNKTFTYLLGTSFVNTITDKDGFVTKFEYDSNELLIAVYKAYGTSQQTQTTNTYDSDGNLTSTTDARGTTTTYTYDSNGLKKTQTVGGDVTIFEYGPYGNLIRVTDPMGKVAEATYNRSGLPLTIADANGNVFTFEYDSNGKKISEINPLGNKTLYVYDQYSRLVRTIDPIGNTIQSEYDAKDRLTRMILADGTILENTYNYQGLRTVEKIGSKLTRYEYDANGNMTKVIDPDGQETSMEYDGNGRKEKISSPGGTVATYQYNGTGNITEIQIPTTGTYLTKVYDGYGRWISASDTIGNLSTRSYDANGNLLSETDANDNTTAYEYDAYNRVVRKVFPDGRATEYEYSSLGNISKITRSNGEVTTFTHDNNGRTLSSNNSRGTLGIDYGADGSILSRTDYLGNVTSYSYDSGGRLITESFQDGTTNQYDYYPDGRLRSKTDKNGIQINYEYNDQGLLTKRDFPGSNDDVFTYNGKGQVLTATNQNSTVQFVYDVDGRVIQSKQDGRITSYAYDMAKRTTSITYPGGEVVTQQHDIRGRFSKIMTGTSDLVTYQYDRGFLQSETLANGDLTTYGYTNGLMSKKLVQDGDSTLLDYDLLYTGGLISKEDRLDDTSETRSYEYDLSERLIKSTVGSGIVTQYNLDGNSNWTSVDQGGTVENRTINTANSTYTAVGPELLNYDLNGNLTEDQTHTYEYDYMNRLVRVIEKAGGTIVAEYAYDALGRRVSKTVNGVTTRFFHDTSNRVVEEQVSGVTMATYIRGKQFNKIHTMTRGGNTYFYHQDIRGNIIKITDQSGNLVESYTYDAYGNVTIFNTSGTMIVTSAIENPYEFAGTRKDAESGFNHMGNRFYSSRLGRFMSHDPSGYEDGPNLYEYAQSNPISNTDFYGLSSEQCFKTQDIGIGGDVNSKIKSLLSKIKIGIKTEVSGGISFQLSECTTECCTKDGKVLRSPIYRKASLTASLTFGGRGIVPAYSFTLMGQEIGLFGVVEVYVKGSGEYEESVDTYCNIKPGGKVCFALGGNVGFDLGFDITVVQAWLQGRIGPSGQVCYGSGGLTYNICFNAGVTLEVRVEIWWGAKYGNSLNIASGKVCYGDSGYTGAVQILFKEYNY